MNCSDTLQLFSPFYDGELPADVRASVESHIQACAACARELSEFQAISVLVNSIPEPRPADGAWQELVSKLDSAKTVSTIVPLSTGRTWFNKNVLLAVVALLVIGVGLAFFLERYEHDNHMAVNFDHYLKEFVHDTKQAQEVLVSAYPNQTIDLEQAAQQLKYKPAATKELPDGYALDSVQVFEMPCCKCIQCIYKNVDNSTLVLFEHDTDQPIWFGERPAITCQCNGTSTRIVTYGDQLAASWPSGKRHLTLIGVHDTKQVLQIMDHLDANTTDNKANPLRQRAIRKNVTIAQPPQTSKLFRSAAFVGGFLSDRVLTTVLP